MKLSLLFLFSFSFNQHSFGQALTSWLTVSELEEKIELANVIRDQDFKSVTLSEILEDWKLAQKKIIEDYRYTVLYFLNDDSKIFVSTIEVKNNKVIGKRDVILNRRILESRWICYPTFQLCSTKAKLDSILFNNKEYKALLLDHIADHNEITYSYSVLAQFQTNKINDCNDPLKIFPAISIDSIVNRISFSLKETYGAQFLKVPLKFKLNACSFPSSFSAGLLYNLQNTSNQFLEDYNGSTFYIIDFKHKRK